MIPREIAGGCIRSDILWEGKWADTKKINGGEAGI